MAQRPSPPGPPAAQTSVEALTVKLRDVTAQLDLARKRRRRDTLIVGIGVSLIVHLLLMYFFASQFRQGADGAASSAVVYDFAIVSDDQLTEMDQPELEELQPDMLSELDTFEESPEAVLDPTIAMADLDVPATGAAPTLSGAGSGSESGSTLSGGGADTSFFGVSSRGMRFAYIVDRSGSMSNDQKMQVAISELARSVSNLPDYASFFVVMFSTRPVEPPMQSGWMKAKPSTISRFVRWLNTVEADGGTEPAPAFQRVFNQETRPDVIFFLTDGQIPDETVDIVEELNKRGARVIINTIAFGDPTSQELLKHIAQQSGGVYRFVATER